MSLSDQHHCQLCNKLLVDPWYVISGVRGERVANGFGKIVAGPLVESASKVVHLCAVCMGESTVGRVLLQSGWEVER